MWKSQKKLISRQRRSDFKNVPVCFSEQSTQPTHKHSLTHMNPAVTTPKDCVKQENHQIDFRQ